ncbi:hypothetical protein FHS43_000815 [Streptosporangium becharense]|uniref:Uncharacterized protein n=1 Tax=Streptosporangium becharense TaxID=1816182 RepID=A0A7W9MG44_9ACTN|nr:hypothetical protein [Streptosporangium becharense]MBB2909569.1 hypothetical protein [Streptosporangium becharense]MBB5819475.1 hypothetical protein [Streptosporangium becharense]
MPLLDHALYALVIMHGFWAGPWMLIIIALGAAYLGGRAVEWIPFTRRIIERREAEERG